MKYDSVEKMFHQLDNKKFNEWFNKRFNSDSTYHFSIDINGSKAFFYYEVGLFNKLLDIQQKNDELNSLFSQLTLIASKQYIRNSLVIDVKKTNEIEGVFSSRKEIFELTEDLKKRQSNKIGSIVNKYLMLMEGKGEKISKCEDIRKVYDDMFFSNDESLIDPDKKPDGVLFRKDYVGVYDLGSTEPIHKGVVPEEKIIEYLTEAISILNNKDLNKFVRIALFHYIFEYVHPFYDGNGRIGRYLISSFVRNEISVIFAFRISSGINNFKNKYYKAFKDTGSVLNKGDLTLFVYEFLDILEKAYDDCIRYARERKIALESKYDSLMNSLDKLSKSEQSVLFVLAQATIFSDFGVTVQDIRKTLNISVRTIRRCLDLFKRKNLLKEQKFSRQVYFTLN